MHRKEPMTVQELIDELYKVKDKSNHINVYNSKGELTANIALFHEKWCIIIDGDKPFYKQYQEETSK